MFESAIAVSLPQPAWLAETQTLWPHWKAQGDELRQAKRDATLLWIKLQEDAGLDIIEFDEPAFNVYLKDAATWGVQALERAARGLTCTTAVHMCDGYGIKANCWPAKT